MKRNVMISGEFSINEVANTNGASQPKPNKKTASARIEALKAAGVDVSNFFAMGDDMVVRVDNGVPTQVLNDDPVFAKIASSGYIAHNKLYRRWVMAQMFHMLREMNENKQSRLSFTGVLQNRGYEYSWKMVEQELLAQYKMFKHGDMESFNERNRWFNKDIVAEMAEDYLDHLRKVVERIKEHKCRGRLYKRIFGKNVFSDEIESVVFPPIAWAVNTIREAKSAYQLYKAVVAFNRDRHSLRWETKQSKAFVDAYKGSGAFFTMKNLILFHGARFHGFTTVKQSLARMEVFTLNLEGWELLGAMKQLIEDSGISVEKKIAEWKK